MNLVHQSEAFVDFNAPKMCACLVLKTNRHTAFAVPLQLALFAAPTSIRITGEPRPAIPAHFRAFRRMARQRPIPSHRAGLPPAPARLAMLEAGFFLLRSPYAIAHSIPRKGPPVKGRAELFHGSRAELFHGSRTNEQTVNRRVQIPRLRSALAPLRSG